MPNTADLLVQPLRFLGEPGYGVKIALAGCDQCSLPDLLQIAFELSKGCRERDMTMLIHSAGLRAGGVV